MKKTEFLTALGERLSGLEPNDLAERLAFYDEIIEDYKADGISEEDAVARIGTVDEIVAQVMSEIPLTKLVAVKMKPKTETAPEAGKGKESHGGRILLVILTFPFWFPFLVTILSLVFSLYIALWAIVIAFFAVDLAFFCAAILGGLSVIPLAMSGNGPMAGLMGGAALLCGGLCMLFFSLSRLILKGAIKLGGGFLLWVKTLFVGKGERKYA